MRARYISVKTLARYYARRLLVAGSMGVLCAGMFGASAQAKATCPNEGLRTEQPYGQGLSDCRAYELVSPLNKNSNNVSYGQSRASVSESSPALTYVSPGSFSEPKSALLDGRYVSRRTLAGWVTQNVSPPFTAVESELAPPFSQLLFTPDLEKGVLTSEFTPLVENEPEGFVNLYVADTASGTYQTVTTIHPPELQPYKFNASRPQLYSDGTSVDLSHIVFQEKGNLLGSNNQSVARTHIYEWANGTIYLVDEPPAGVNFEAEDEAGAPYDTQVGPADGDEWHSVSADGSRIFFTVGEGEGEEAEGQLYVRENADKPPSPYIAGKCSIPGDACTVMVSDSQREPADPHDHANPIEGDPNGKRPARFWGASADGSRVFFTSRAELTNDANTGLEDNAENLYEYDLQDGALVDLTVDPNPGDQYGAAVLGVVTMSEDGSYVYFVAEGRLAEEENNKAPELDKPNLYVYHEGKVTFIATLEPASFLGSGINEGGQERGGDSEDWRGEQEEHTNIPSTGFGPSEHVVRITASGIRLAFESKRSLTGFDNEPAEAGACENERCREIYLYDATSGKLICISCDRSGARPVGPAKFGGHEEDTEEGGVQPSPFYVSQNLSQGGERLFFESPDALVSQDTNGRLDVYEWEVQGEGSCVEAVGCVFPVSDVSGSFDSRFMDATPSGENVFIATKDQLISEANEDSRINIYDAKVDGGFPVPAVASPCMNADACKPTSSPQPSVFGEPASAEFSGAGNVSPLFVTPKPTVGKRCSKGFTRRRGKCVRTRSRRSRNGRKIRNGGKRKGRNNG